MVTASWVICNTVSADVIVREPPDLPGMTLPAAVIVVPKE